MKLLSFAWMGWFGLAWLAPASLAQGTESQTLIVDQDVQVYEQSLRKRAWDLDPEGLPKAKAGRWENWTSQSPPDSKTIADLYDFAHSAYRRGDLVLAAGYAQRLLEEAADYPPGLLLLGMTYYRLQRYGNGVECYQRLLHHAPDALARTRQYGHCLHELGRHEEAEAHFTRLLAVDSTPWKTQQARAVTRLRLGHTEAALADIEAAKKEASEDPTVLYWHASILYELEDAKAALQAALAARDADPYASRTWFLLAQNLFEQETPPESAETAQARYQELLATETTVRNWQQEVYLDPTRLDLLEKIARLYLAGGDLANAEVAFQRLGSRATHLQNQAYVAKARRALAGIQQVR